MTKIEITDEMVRRFTQYVNNHEGCMWRDALESALNPPPEPEIEVTKEMIDAGWDNFRIKEKTQIANIYRAMRRVAPHYNLPQYTTHYQTTDQQPSGAPHVTGKYEIHRRKEDGLKPATAHRRKDDPL